MATSTQVNHGLNLVLKLREGASMPELLGKIAAAQPKIGAGLDELNFVHFARFLPTYDEKALQVITEFDGPLAPYVLDFALEIGDVFDMLLNHTEGTEQIVPIAEHPAEFLAFVEKYNRVTVAGQPFPREWDLYSAYRDTTVLDIIGPRSELPRPKVDRIATPVRADDVQGNILKGYRAERVTHLLLQVCDASAARAWLVARARPGEGMAGSPTLTSFEACMGDATPKLMLNVGLTASGMAALGIREPWRAPFPLAFTQGALTRAADNFDIGSNAPEHWWLGGPEPEREIHVMVSLYQFQRNLTDDASFKDATAALVASLPEGGLRLIHSQDAEHLGGRGQLGYADGIAHPRVAGIHGTDRTDLQPASTVGEFVLGAEYKNIYGGSSLGALPSALASNGTFCAVRVLAQDPTVFQEALQSEARRLGVRSDWLAAKLMGRWFDGGPISLHPDQPPADSAENRRNDFDYAPSHEFPSTPMDHTGLRCPVGAHIRRGNPRAARIAGARYARRLMRRGMNYTREVRVGDEMKIELGLFGLFICADLERQFEFIQRQWLNGDRFASGLRGTRDPFGGTPQGEFHEFDIPMPNGPSLNVRLPQFVHTRGSLYLFMPGLTALRQLDHFATEDPPAPVAVPAPPALPPGSQIIADGN